MPNTVNTSQFTLTDEEIRVYHINPKKYILGSFSASENFVSEISALINPSSTNPEPTTTINFDNLCSFFLLKSFSQIPESKNPSSFTVDYLINSCGLSPKTALTASTKIQFTSTERPDSILDFFLSNGLTKTQITTLISSRPLYLLSDSDKNFKPKLEYLTSLGFSDSNRAKILASDPSLLGRSLSNHIIPCFNFLKSYIHRSDDILMAIRRSSWMLQYDLVKVMEPNISTLRDHGVPDSNISKFLMCHPRKLMHREDRFKEIVEKIDGMGFDPSSPMFYHAVRTMGALSKLNWEKKMMIYQNFGLSEEEALLLFKKQPLCFMISEEKIQSGVKFFMEKLKWTTKDISEWPALLFFNLEKRTIPRCAVLEILNSKGIRRKSKLGTVLKLAERLFLQRFVNKYCKTVPEVMKAYNGEIEFTGFGENGEDIYGRAYANTLSVSS